MNKTATELWNAMLVELQGQMTKATFDTWVKPSFPISLRGNVLTLGVRNAYAQQWLSQQLSAMLSRTARHVADADIELNFVLKPPTEKEPATEEAESPPKPGDIYVEFIESPLKPFLLVQKYAIWYWQPLLGSLAFSTWLMLRTLDKVNEGRGIKHRLSVEIIALTLDCHRQSLTGRNPSEKVEGAFGILNAFHLSRIDVIGKGHDAMYWARVLNAVPLLTPSQVETLPKLLRERHAKFLSDFAIDAEKWEQLEIPTLIQD